MSLGKHFINDVDDPVERALKSLLRLDQSLRLIESQKVIYRQQTRPKVLLLSGGGSGHEPAHAGYLGDGMLDICIAGQIFASPSASQVLAGLTALDAPLGVLMIVKNYTGDKLNFGLAAQKAKAKGIKVNVVFVGDDISVEGNDLVGRRGLAGVVFVHKIAGALAARGATLEEVTAIAQRVADNIYTVGVSLDRCSVPRRTRQESLPVENLEYGMGIQNEPGVRRDIIPSLSTTVRNVLSFMPPLVSDGGSLSTAVMINNLGGLSVLELNVIAGEVMDQLEGKGLQIRRMLVGTFVTCLDGPGFSVTILRLHSGFEDLLNVRTTAPAWPNLELPNHGNVNGAHERTIEESKHHHLSPNEHRFSVDATIFHNITKSVVANVIQIQDEPQITKYDTIAGDGDCGETLLKGVNAIQDTFSKSTLQTLDLIPTLHTLSATVESSMGGTSGALYAIFFNALANSLSNNSSFTNTSPHLTQILASSLRTALGELQTYTTARIGHKTLMDALIPFVTAFAQTLDFGRAVGEAEKGAIATRELDAVLGRASYVGKNGLEAVPDPGAVGVVSVLKGIGKGLEMSRESDEADVK